MFGKVASDILNSVLFFKKFNGKYLNPTILILFVILLLGLFFRTYKAAMFYPFAHDEDLYSWIVKDILVNHHLRLIGQLTSVDGVFVGPLFYYLLVPFFALTRLDPIGATIFATFVGLATIFSLYFVFSRFFGKNAGLIAAFLYAVSMPNVFFDRWVVPTQPTILWSVWFLYALFVLEKGERKSLFILAILFALVWHIHIALLPLAILVPLTIILAKKKIKAVDYILPILLFLFLMTPFWLFEFKHNFQQIHGMISGLAGQSGEAKGLYRVLIVIEESASSLNANLNYGFRIPAASAVFLNLVPFLFLTFFVGVKKLLSKKRLIILAFWVLVILLVQMISKRQVSEYYFSNLTVVSILILSLFLAYIANFYLGKILVVILAFIFLVFNFYQLLTLPNAPGNYLQKKQVVTYIKNDALKRSYPCVGITYITGLGEGVGFRYLFWYEGLKAILPGRGEPVYNIVIPASTSYNEVNTIFGNIGVIKPKVVKFDNKDICNDPNNQFSPLLGFYD